MAHVKRRQTPCSPTFDEHVPPPKRQRIVRSCPGPQPDLDSQAAAELDARLPSLQECGKLADELFRHGRPVSAYHTLREWLSMSSDTCAHVRAVRDLAFLAAFIHAHFDQYRDQVHGVAQEEWKVRAREFVEVARTLDGSREVLAQTLLEFRVFVLTHDYTDPRHSPVLFERIRRVTSLVWRVQGGGFCEKVQIDSVAQVFVFQGM